MKSEALTRGESLAPQPPIVDQSRAPQKDQADKGYNALLERRGCLLASRAAHFGAPGAFSAFFSRA